MEATRQIHGHSSNWTWSTAVERCEQCRADYRHLTDEVPDFYRMHASAQAHHVRQILGR